MIQTLRTFLHKLGRFRWAFPLLMLGVGYWIPPLRAPVEIPASNGLWASVVISLILVVIWIISEVITVTNRTTPTRHLQWDDLLSLILALAVTLWGGWLISRGLEWWLIIPWLGAVIDAGLSGWLGINNAAQKPLVEQQKG